MKIFIVPRITFSNRAEFFWTTLYDYVHWCILILDQRSRFAEKSMSTANTSCKLKHISVFKCQRVELIWFGVYHASKTRKIFIGIQGLAEFHATSLKVYFCYYRFFKGVYSCSLTTVRNSHINWPVMMYIPTTLLWPHVDRILRSNHWHPVSSVQPTSLKMVSPKLVAELTSQLFRQTSITLLLSKFNNCVSMTRKRKLPWIRIVPQEKVSKMWTSRKAPFKKRKETRAKRVATEL
jgi:hypothetical protein